jgi:hypothetical protein
MNVCLKGANVRAKRGFKKVRLRGEVGAGSERFSLVAGELYWHISYLSVFRHHKGLIEGLQALVHEALPNRIARYPEQPKAIGTTLASFG